MPNSPCQYSMTDVDIDARIAPPGWYMLFLTDTGGVPSAAHWVHLS